MMKTQVLGIGNTILSDDGAGVRIVEKLREGNVPSNVVLTDAGTGGLGILDLLDECERLIVVDAVISGAPPGTIHQLSMEDFSANGSIHLCSAHGIDFFTVLTLYTKAMGKRVPRVIEIIGIEAEDATTFSEVCTKPVAEAVDRVVRRIKLMLEEK